MTTKPRLRGITTIADRPARIGKLKIGEKREKTRQDGSVVEYPTKLDYIRAVDGAGNPVEAFHAVFGEKPTEFRAVFPSNNPDDFYWEAYRRYGAGTGLVCHGDGRQAIVEETGETIDCPCQYAEGERPTCKPVASLSLFVYEVPALGVFQIDTGSINSIKNIRWFLHALPQLTGGQYTGIPFRVRIEPFQAVHEGKASVAYQWKLDLLPGYSPMNLRLAAEDAVGAFLVPPAVAQHPMLDEAKPAELYAELPAGGAPEEVQEQQSEPPEELSSVLAGAEALFRAAVGRLSAPPAKIEAILSTQKQNRAKAAATGSWEAYHRWLRTQTEQLNRQANKAQGALV